ncbi:AbiH family protein [Segatella copri]|uniref:AbiH family protein n=1 Tax=Segatella copri TaxID=165179 RepID=UPI002FF31E3A
MDKTINTTLIIGNGFDLSMGKHTSYKEFYEKLVKNKGFWDNHSGNSLLEYIKDNGGSKEFWYDFENIILHYSFESENGKKLKELEKSKTSDDRLVEKIVAEVKEGIELLKEELVKFLSDAKPDNDCLYPTCRIFTAILGASGKNAKELVTSLLERKKAKETWEFPNNKIISFNYLDAPSNFSFYLQFFIYKNVKSPCSPPIGIKADDLAGMFVFLHNSLDFWNRSNLHPGLVFGTNDDERMPKALYFLRKSSQLGYDAKKSFTDTLNQSKRIVIFGLSLVGIDYDYFKEFFETDHDSDTEVVIINKKGALDNIRKILKEKGCKRQVSYLDIDLDIDKGSIVTDAVKMNKKICYSNFIGLCDTIAEESVASEHRNIVQVNNVFEVRPRYDKR